MSDLSCPQLRVANLEACYHNKRQKDCHYFQNHGCRCNVPGQECSVDGVPVKYVEETFPKLKTWGMWIKSLISL
jgi:hypothetical protein